MNKVKKYTSKPIKLAISGLKGKLKRVDLEFHGIDHSEDSFEALVFLNNPKATDKTPVTAEKGYLGSFYVFGHGGCYGDKGHCCVPESRRAYDRRPPHPLEPIKRRLDATAAINEIAGAGKRAFTVTVVPVVRGTKRSDKAKAKNVLSLEGISVVVYD